MSRTYLACASCRKGECAKCDGFEGNHGHPDSRSLCLCPNCQPIRYKRLIENGWVNQ